MSARRPISLVLLLIAAVACAGCKGVTIGADNKYGEARAMAMVPVPLDKFPALVAPPRLDGPLSGRVLSVHDGDSLTVLIDGHVDGWAEEVKLIGVDAPELERVPWGIQAHDALRALVEGKIVRIETDITVRDPRKRLLAYVYVGGTFVNLEMVRQGHAVLDTVLPNVLHEAEYRKAQEEARRAGRGVWNPTKLLP